MTLLRGTSRNPMLSLGIALALVMASGARAAPPPADEAPVATPVSGASASPLREPYVEPWKMGLRSLVFPGWGQHGVKEPGRGYAFTLAAAGALLFATGVISFGATEGSRKALEAAGWLGYGFTASISAWDAWTRAEALNRENGYELGAASRSPELRLTVLRTKF